MVNSKRQMDLRFSIEIKYSHAKSIFKIEFVPSLYFTVWIACMWILSKCVYCQQMHFQRTITNPFDRFWTFLLEVKIISKWQVNFISMRIWDNHNSSHLNVISDLEMASNKAKVYRNCATVQIHTPIYSNYNIQIFEEFAVASYDLNWT